MAKPIDNPICKRATGTWRYGNGNAKALRVWVAICPLCTTMITRPPSYYAFSYGGHYTRKSMKDALHQHLLLHHR